jgi:hypothetical protein
MNRRPIDFDKLVNQVRKPTVGQEHLAIWGGTCAEDALTDFLTGWDLKRMPYRIWESTDRIEFGKNEQAPNVALLERGRLFGLGGDLDLRHDGEVFRWRFVGDPDVRPPEGYDAEENNFWKQHPDPDVAFHCYDESALLWGEHQGDRWHDDRVAAAELDYLESDDAERVQVKYKVYSRAGRVEFVWLTKLQECKEEDGA